MKRPKAKPTAIVVGALTMVACLAAWILFLGDGSPFAGDSHSDSALPFVEPSPVVPGSNSPSGTASPADPAVLSPNDLFPSGGRATLPKTNIKLHPRGLHHVTMTVTGDGNFAQVGYLVPTSQDAPIVSGRNEGSPWSRSTTATGTGYLALLFVQAGPTGGNVSCSISVDGVVKASDSKTGQYAQLVCLA